jgi:hypothetical protein
MLSRLFSKVPFINPSHLNTQIVKLNIYKRNIYSIYLYSNGIFKIINDDHHHHNNTTSNNILTSTYTKFHSIEYNLSWLSCLFFSLCLITKSHCDDDKNSNKLNLLSIEFMKELHIVLKYDQIETDEDECASRGKPWNSYHSVRSNPQCVLFPETTEDVSNIVKICHKYHIPIGPFGIIFLYIFEYSS